MAGLPRFRARAIPMLLVIFALAIGIALGAGPLGDDVESAEPPPKTVPTPTETDTRRALEYAEAFVTAGAPRLYANGLESHAVAVLALPGADVSLIKALNTEVLAAGGAISGTFTISESLLETGQRSVVDTLASDLTTQLADPRVDPAATTYVKMGQLMALAMATDQTSSVRADTAAVTVRQALEDAGLLDSPKDIRNAPLILVVLPPGAQGDDSFAAQTILSGLVNGLASNAAGLVVTGDQDSVADGELAALRESELAGPIATVDGVQSAIGRVTTVLALASVIGGVTGAFGESGADGPVPLG